MSLGSAHGSCGAGETSLRCWVRMRIPLAAHHELRSVGHGRRVHRTFRLRLGGIHPQGLVERCEPQWLRLNGGRDRDAAFIRSAGWWPANFVQSVPITIPVIWQPAERPVTVSLSRASSELARGAPDPDQGRASLIGDLGDRDAGAEAA